MKKFILAAIAVVTMGIVSVPSQTQAAQHVPMPKPVIGISEETYQDLLTIDCDIDVTETCTDLNYVLRGRVVMRTEAQGQMYWVDYRDGGSGLTPYLADGFYKTTNGDTTKYFVVVDGKKKRLRKGNAFSHVKAAATAGYLTGVSAENFDLMSIQSCHGDTCMSDFNAGKALRQSLNSRFVLNTETGEIAVVMEGSADFPAFVPLSKNMGVIEGDRTMSFFAFAKANAERVSSQKMREMVSLDRFL